MNTTTSTQTAILDMGDILGPLAPNGRFRLPGRNVGHIVAPTSDPKYHHEAIYHMMTYINDHIPSMYPQIQTTIDRVQDETANDIDARQRVQESLYEDLVNVLDAIAPNGASFGPHNEYGGYCDQLGFWHTDRKQNPEHVQIADEIANHLHQLDPVQAAILYIDHPEVKRDDIFCALLHPHPAPDALMLLSWMADAVLLIMDDRRHRPDLALGAHLPHVYPVTYLRIAQKNDDPNTIRITLRKMHPNGQEMTWTGAPTRINNVDALHLAAQAEMGPPVITECGATSITTYGNDEETLASA